MSDQLTVLYIVRHGESKGNVKKIVQGQSGPGLTEQGESQASQLADKLRHVKFDLVFSSDAVRAHRTAEIIALEKQLAVNTNALLREHNMGRWEGMAEAEYLAANKVLLEKYDRYSEQEKWKSKISADVESDEEVNTRFLRFIRETAVTYRGKTILVATHGGVMRCFLVHMGWSTHKELPVGSVKNTAFIKLRTDGMEFFIDDIVGVTKKSTV